MSSIKMDISLLVILITKCKTLYISHEIINSLQMKMLEKLVIAISFQLEVVHFA
jgi:hypothetical protein